MKNHIITILCSGVALGVYIPGLLIRDTLEKKGYLTEIALIENLYQEDVLKKIPQNKWHFHKNMRLAKKAHQKTNSMIDSIDGDQLNQLMKKWQDEGRDRFIIVSGFWVSVVDKYQVQSGLDCKIDCVHMDSIVSSSWTLNQELWANYHNLWPFSYDNSKVNCQIEITDLDLDHFDSRKDSVLVHGGGWGMGNYQTILPELTEKGISTNCILYYREEHTQSSPYLNYYYLDSNWTPWQGEGMLDYPPLFTVDPNGSLEAFKTLHPHHVFDLIVASKAIISKPGGATLLDSFASATPILFLDPVGAYEEKNAKLWIKLGFGYPYEMWKNSGYSFQMLETANRKLIKARNEVKRIEELLCSLEQI